MTRYSPGFTLGTFAEFTVTDVLALQAGMRSLSGNYIAFSERYVMFTRGSFG